MTFISKLDFKIGPISVFNLIHYVIIFELSVWMTNIWFGIHKLFVQFHTIWLSPQRVKKYYFATTVIHVAYDASYYSVGGIYLHIPHIPACCIWLILMSTVDKMTWQINALVCTKDKRYIYHSTFSSYTLEPQLSLLIKIYKSRTADITLCYFGMFGIYVTSSFKFKDCLRCSFDIW